MNRIVAVFVFIISIGFIYGQNNEKLAAAFRYRNEQMLNRVQGDVPTLFNKSESKRMNRLTGQSEVGYNCIIYTKSPEVLKTNGITLQSIHDTFVTAWLSLDQINKVATFAEVDFVDTPKFLKKTNDISVATSGAALLHSGKLDNTVYKGDGVIIAIIDTGIDWDHPDFRNASDQTKSRIVRIWDQTLTPNAGESSPTGFAFGVEYTQTQINDEIDGTPAGFVREKDTDGHGTHIAGIAAGNGSASNTKYEGLAPNADLVIVKAGDGTFDTSNLIIALDYLKNLATSLGKPIVVNLSLGSQMGAHDGTDPLEVAIDNFTNAAAGRMVVVATGNENGENLHKQIALAASSNTSVGLQVPTASASTSTEVFQFSFYANNTNSLTVSLTAPDGSTANTLGAIGTSVFGGKAKVFLSNFIDPESGDRKVQVYVTRATTSTDVSGSWVINLANSTTTATTIDGWLDMKGDDFISTTLTGGDSNYLVSIPGCATKAITVGAYMAKMDWYASSGSGYNYTSGVQDDISGFSSIGPRRDGVLKPDITANGQAVVSCLSSDSGVANSSPYMVVNGLYRVEQGTSMATPTVAGCVALLLQKKSNATFAQIKTAISSTATKDSFTGATDNAIWGSGKIDVFKAASTFSYCQPLARITYNYEQSYGSTTNYSYSLSSKRAALRFTSTSSGALGGVYFKTTSTTTVSSFTIELRANNAGIPGTLIGSLPVTATKIAKNTWNYIDLSSLGATIQNGTDYFVVLIPGSSDTFSLGQESINSSRSYTSTTGSTWTSVSNLRIRPVVYATTGDLIPSMALTSAAGTPIQNKTINTVITPIAYSTIGASGATFSGLPAGVSGVWTSNTVTISGTPTVAGVFNYTVNLIVGCNSVSASGVITVIADADGDGISDSLDLCPNTPVGTQVDFNGCAIFTVASDNYSVMATATTCVGQQNGAISVSAKNTSYTYSVSVNGQLAFELNATNSFKSQVQNLPPGTYEICISIQGKANYSQCYTLKVTEPTPLSATNKMISSSSKQVTYSLPNATNYIVTLNGKTQTYTTNVLTLDLSSGQNAIQITTDLPCQGVYNDSIYLGEQLLLYPNPSADDVQLYLAGSDTQVKITLTTFSGEKVAVFSTPIPENRTIQFNVAPYASGLYLVKIEGDMIKETIKLIKK